MRSAALHVHWGGPDNSVLLASLHQLQAVQIVAHVILWESFHKYPIYLALVYVKRLRAGVILEKIVDLLVVDLQKGAVDFGIQHILIFRLLNAIEQLIYRSRSNPRIVLVVLDLLEEGMLMECFWGLAYRTLPVAPEHRIGFPWISRWVPDPVCP